MAKSLLDHAYDFINQSKGQVSFKNLWAYICKAADLSEEEASRRLAGFYTNLMLDGRFVTLGENQWDLRERHTFDKVHIDMKDVYSDVESDVNDDAEEADEDEEKEYNKAFEEPNEENEEEEGSESEEERINEEEER